MGLYPWMDQYDYIYVIANYLFIFTKNTAGILEPLKKLLGFELRGFLTTEYYNGGDVGYDKEKGK